MDETYVKVKGRWVYLYRAVTKDGDTLDFFLSSIRSAKATKRFLGKLLDQCKEDEFPEVINTDQAPSYGAALRELKKEKCCPEEVLHRQVKYLNNVIESDHGKLKILINPVRGFKTMKTAYATIKGFEVMRALKKKQAGIFQIQDGIRGEIRLVERAFRLGACPVQEVMERVKQ